jgi:CheY-like chemotaxis protein
MTKALPPKNFVLYADDDPDDRELVREIFAQESSDIELLTFSSGRELLRYLDSQAPFSPKPCLVILDVNMPLLNGKEALKALRQKEGYADIPVVLFTTSTLPSEAAFAKSFDAGFITKPLHREQIHHIFDKFIEHCSDDTKKRINWKRKN